MHATYDAHDEAPLLCAVHEGHQDLATLLYVTNALHLLQEGKRACEPGRERARQLDGSFGKGSVERRKSWASASEFSTMDSIPRPAPGLQEEEMVKAKGSQPEAQETRGFTLTQTG